MQSFPPFIHSDTGSSCRPSISISRHHPVFFFIPGQRRRRGGGRGLTRGHVPLRCFVVQRCLGGGEESERKRRSRGTISPRRSHQQLWCGWKTAPGGFSSFADTVSLQLSLPIRRLALISHTPRHLAPSPQQGACDIKPNLFLTNL